MQPHFRQITLIGAYICLMKKYYNFMKMICFMLRFGMCLTLGDVCA